MRRSLHGAAWLVVSAGVVSDIFAAAMVVEFHNCASPRMGRAGRVSSCARLAFGKVRRGVRRDGCSLQRSHVFVVTVAIVRRGVVMGAMGYFIRVAKLGKGRTLGRAGCFVQRDASIMRDAGIGGFDLGIFGNPVGFESAAEAKNQ